MSDFLAELVSMADAERPGFALALGYTAGSKPPHASALGGIPPAVGEIYASLAGTPRSIPDQRLMDIVPGHRLIHWAELSEVKDTFLRVWPDLESLSPFLADYSGSYYMLDVRSGHVVAVTPGDGPATVALDLRAFWATIARCYREGAYFVDEDGYLDYDPDRAAAIGAEMNPGCEFWRS
jgi:hypothetical protein